MNTFLFKTKYKSIRIFEDVDVPAELEIYKNNNMFLKLGNIQIVSGDSNTPEKIAIPYLDTHTMSRNYYEISTKDVYLVCNKFRLKQDQKEEFSIHYYGTADLQNEILYDYNNEYAYSKKNKGDGVSLKLLDTFNYIYRLKDLENIKDKNLTRDEYEKLLEELKNDVFIGSNNIDYDTVKTYSLKTFHPEGLTLKDYIRYLNSNNIPNEKRIIYDRYDVINKLKNIKNFSNKSFHVSDNGIITGMIQPSSHNIRRYAISSKDFVEVEIDKDAKKIIQRPPLIEPIYLRFRSLQPEDLVTGLREEYIRREFKLLDFGDMYCNEKYERIDISEINNDSYIQNKNDGTYIKISDLEVYEPNDPDNRPDRIYWTRPETKRYNIFGDYLIDQIRTRYAMYSLPRNGLQNVIIDSCVPKLLYATNFDIPKAREILKPPKTASAISPWFANMFGVRQIPSEQLFRILGYDRKMLSNLIQKVARKKYDFMFIGFGGTCINTATWLDEILKLTNKVDLFNSVTVVEPDDVELSNLLRFPVDPTTIHDTSFGSSKLSLAGDRLKRLSSQSPLLYTKKYSPTKIGRDFIDYFHDYEYNRDESGNLIKDENGNFHKINIKIKSAKHIIYGAPNIDTRAELSPYGNFISATHGGEECSLWLNPEYGNTSLQVETYGVIQLSSFYMNQIRMAIGLLEMLAEDNFDPQAKDVEVMNYKFDGITVKSTDFKYNFQLEHSGNITTADEARTI